LGATQKDKELRELAGRKGQLERDIVKNFAIIESASVQLTLPEKASIFEESTQKGSASVTIGLRKGTQISEQQLIGLQHMVSTAIPGVKAEEVKVIDNEQGIISNGTGDNKSTMSTAYEKQMQIQEKTEENIIEDIRTSLTTFFGYDNLTLNVKVGINFDEIFKTLKSIQT
jgi:flagellar M-ring protein FliF